MLPTNRNHLPILLVFRLGLPLGEAGVAAVGEMFFLEMSVNERTNIFTFAQWGEKVDLGGIKKAVFELSVGGETDAVATFAEWVGDSADDPESTGAAICLKSAGSIVQLTSDRLEFKLPTNTGEQIRIGNDFGQIPLITLERHELDKTDVKARLRERHPHKVIDLIIIRSPHDHHIQFHHKAFIEEQADVVQCFAKMITLRNEPEPLFLQRIQADVQRSHPGRFQFRYELIYINGIGR